MTGAARTFGIAMALAASATSLAAQGATPGFALTAPAAPGGGWDQLARTMQRVLDATALAPGTHVDNIPGAAGTIGLARFVSAKRGDPNALLVTGLVMLGGIANNRSPVTLAQTTPIARLTGEWEVLAVPASSPFQSLGALITALKVRPGAISWGGGSAGGTDQILVDLIAEAVGVSPARTNYVAFAGGGEAVAALLGGQVTVGVSGWGEFAPHVASGRLRALAISSPTRQADVDVPTFRELGIPVELANWRGIVAPPGIAPAERARVIGVIERMVKSDAWRRELQRRGWSDLWLAGEAFTRFAQSESRRVDGIVARRRGVDGPAVRSESTASLATIGMWGVALTLVLLGAGVLRGRAPPATVPAGVSARPLAQIALGMAIDLALAPWTGFIVASAVLFYLTARAFGESRRALAVVTAIVFCAAAFAVFTYALGLSLPVGRLWSAQG